MSGFSAAALAGASFHRQQPLPSLPSMSTCHCHPPLSCASGPAPGLDPGAGEASPAPGHCSLSSGLSQVRCQTDTESRLLIAIRSRRSSPQDRNAIFSLNYVKSFREGGEII